MYTINCNGKLLSLATPVVMGILNTTPDSFFAASRTSADDVLRKAEAMLEAGAAILDMGGQSTRPGAVKVSADEERARVLPAIEVVHQRFPEAVISIDTFYAFVARDAVAAGAAIVNDVSGGTLDADTISTVAQMAVPYVLTHMKGEPQTMQQSPHYNDVVLDVFDGLNFRMAALHQAGIKDVIIDPGFGFGKTTVHNFTLLRHLPFFKQLQKPLMVGISRKGMVHRTLGIKADEALNGSTVLHTIALMNGANILRVHDVKEAVEVVKLVGAVVG